VKESGFRDTRPWFVVYVAGRADLIPLGPWAYSAFTERVLIRPEAVPLVVYLDDALRHKRGTHQVLIYCRAEMNGVNAIVRAYAAARFGRCLLATCEPALFGDQAAFRRDVCQLARSHALVWYGPREDRDPVTLAALLGVPYRVVAAPRGRTEDEEEEPHCGNGQADELLEGG
jgi:hypothetical protein